MAIYLTLSTKVGITGKREILIRFKQGEFAQRSKTGIFIEEKYWDAKTEQINPKRYVLKDEYKEYLNKLNDKLN